MQPKSSVHSCAKKPFERLPSHHMAVRAGPRCLRRPPSSLAGQRERAGRHWPALAGFSSLSFLKTIVFLKQVTKLLFFNVCFNF